MAQGQEVGVGCANRFGGQWQPRQVVVTTLDVHMHTKIDIVNKIWAGLLCRA